MKSPNEARSMRSLRFPAPPPQPTSWASLELQLPTSKLFWLSAFGFFSYQCLSAVTSPADPFQANDSAIARLIYSLPTRIAFSIEFPNARLAAIAAESVQPVPWVEGPT